VEGGKVGMECQTISTCKGKCMRGLPMKKHLSTGSHDGGAHELAPANGHCLYVTFAGTFARSLSVVTVVLGGDTVVLWLYFPAMKSS
jgi:hypothetical protein